MLGTRILFLIPPCEAETDMEWGPQPPSVPQGDTGHSSCCSHQATFAPGRSPASLSPGPKPTGPRTHIHMLAAREAGKASVCSCRCLKRKEGGTPPSLSARSRKVGEWRGVQEQAAPPSASDPPSPLAPDWFEGQVGEKCNIACEAEVPLGRDFATPGK